MEGGLRDLVYDFKFSGQRYLARYIGWGMAEVAVRMLPEDAAVAAVPLHEDKLRQRGFNQAEALAEAVAGRLGVPFLRGLLVRVKRTSSLSGMGAAERRKELEGAFELRGSSLGRPEPLPPTVLLVDDIYTTGATVDACARALKRAGVRRVNVLVAARST